LHGRREESLYPLGRFGKELNPMTHDPNMPDQNEADRLL
jgi:hypothetical protein